MTTIFDYYKYSYLAAAAYVDLGNAPLNKTQISVGDFVLASNTQGRLPSPLTNYLFNPDFADYGPRQPWAIDYYQPNDAVGFAATLFQQGNEKVLALRGTEPRTQQGIDLWQADLAGIGLLGMAFTQAVSMVNLILRMAAPAGAQVSQLRIMTSVVPISENGVAAVGLPDADGKTTTVYIDLQASQDGVGLGLLDVAAGEKITVTGHSLGGHLAVLAARLFPNLIKREVFAFNSPGFDPTALNFVPIAPSFLRDKLVSAMGPDISNLDPSAHQLTDELVALFRTALGEGSLLSQAASDFSGLNIFNLESEDVAPGNDGSFVSSVITGQQVLGQETLVITEPNSHVIEPSMDSLALHSLLYGMNNTLTLTDTGKLIESASAKPRDSEEKLTEFLFKLLLKDQKFSDGNGRLVESLPISDAILPQENAGLFPFIGKGAIAARAAFHDAVLRIGVAVKNNPALQLFSLVSISSADLTNIAQGSAAFGFRYAIQELNSFAILGDNSIYTSHNANGELDLYDPASRTGSLTAQWIADRADFLTWKNIAYTNDSTTAQNALSAENWRYVDLPQKLTIAVAGGQSGGASPAISRFAVFGGDGADAVIGGNREDRLYGMGGTDYLEGKASNDYLEGGAGMDVYNFAAIKNALTPNANDGNDTILDTDGKGVLRYTFTDSGLLSSSVQSTAIAGIALRPAGGSSWQSIDGKFNFSLGAGVPSGNNLEVTFNGGVGGSITLKGFKDGDFGIRLLDAPTLPQTDGAVIAGDRKPQDFDPNTSGVQAQTDALGNVIVTAEVQADRDDVLYGDRPGAPVEPTAAGEKIDAGGGHDVIFSDRPRREADNGLGDADWIIARAGRDIIEAGAGNDLIEAGADGVLDGQAGGDVADGGAGNDALYAESQIALAEALRAGNEAAPTNVNGDLLSGADGNDWIIGDRANDLLIGGSGQDLIVGGAGNDTIWGDVDLTTYTRGWHVERIVTIDAGRKTYEARVLGATITDSAIGAADVIYGGRGADWVFAGTGDDFVDAGADGDVAFGEAGSDVLIGGAGNDTIAGDNPDVVASAEEGGDYLDGGAGDDELFGNGGDDILIGGPGNDLLNGGLGRDIYVFNKGDGKDTVVDTLFGIDHPEAGILVLGDGFSRSDIKFRLGSLLVDLGPVDPSDPDSTRDEIRFEGFDQFDPLTTPILGEIRFADGDSMTYEDILAQGFEIDGTEEDDDDHDAEHPMLVGTAVTDRIRGFAGNDILLGAAGDDVLDGGAGDDHLQGGEGNDVLIGGVGVDVLQGEAGADTYLADFDDIIIDDSGGDFIDLGVATPEELAVARFEFGGQPALIVSRSADGDPTRGLTIFGDVTAQNLRFAFVGGELTSDAFFDIAFTGSLDLAGTDDDDVLRGFGGSDVLSGFAGNDSLNGGAGDDVLSGAEGEDTLIGGAGNDFLNGGAGGDIYHFGRGMGLDELSDAGGDGIDRIVLAPDVLRQDVTLARSIEGNLTLVLSPDDRLTVRGHYSDAANRIEEIQFGDGMILTAADLDAVPLPPITGTNGTDVLVGTNFSETLVGLAGDDTLDGRGGNDVLHGGEGFDRYVFHFGMGRDTFVDDGGRIALQPGLGFNDLHAAREDNDLELTIRGTATGALLVDYFVAPQDWTIEDATGAQTTPQAVLEVTAQREQDWVGTQRDDYRNAIKARILSPYLAFGYTVTSEGTLFAPWPVRPWLGSVTASASWNTQTETRTISFFSGATSTTTTTGGFTSWSNTIPLLIDSTVRIDEETIASDDLQIFGFDGRTETNELQSVVASVVWSNVKADLGTISEINRFEFIFGTEPDPNNVGRFLPIGTITTSTVFHSFTGFVTGQVNEISPGAMAQGGLFPQYINARLQLNTIDERISEVIAGPSNNEIAGFTLVDAGEGNDMASGGFVYGGAGDDVINGEIAIGGPGNDWVSGAIIYGGAGDDYLEGSFGASRIVFDVEDFGRDIITATRGLSAEELAAWYYPSIGIPDWEERLFILEEDDFVSVEEAIARGLLPPLPQIAAHDWSALAPLYAVGVIEIDTVEFRQSITSGDLGLSWGEVASTSPVGGALEAYTTLDVSWGAGNVARIVIPHARDPLGTGVEELRFADGAVVSVQDLISAAPPAPSFDPQDQDNVLVGSARGEVILGWAGNDTLEGGPGQDNLQGGEGDDVYVFAQGDGEDYVFDQGGVDLVRFAGEIVPEDILITADPFGALILTLTTGDRLTLPNWFDETARVESVEFMDGTIWGAAQIEARMKVAPATEFDDFIGGTTRDDVIDSLGGNDQINGHGGNDLIAGSGGDDLLQGGAGNDILSGGDGADNLSDEQGNNIFDGGAGEDTIFAYGTPYYPDGGNNFVIGGPGDDWIYSLAANNVIAFNAGDGQDTVYALFDLTLSLGAGIEPSALSLTQAGDDLVLAIGATDSIRLTRRFEPDPHVWPRITLQMFGSVHLYDFNAVIERFQAALAEDPSLAVFPLDGALQAHQTGFSETHALGGPLAYLYGTAGNLNALDDSAMREILGEADFGMTPQSIAVAGSNHAPVVGAPIADQTAAEDAAFSFTLPLDTFTDVDAGDTLTLSATLADGSALPGWLAIDLLSGGFSGTPTNDDVATLDVRVTATDAAGAMVSDEFVLEVLNVNDAPEVVTPLFDQLGNQHAPFSFEVPEGTFVDVDAGDSLRLSAALADGSPLPDWLAFDPVLGSFSGTPSEFDVGAMDIRVVATDNAGASVFDLFTLTVSDASTVNETHIGTERGDVIVTGFANDLIEAGRGNDLVRAGAGRDVVFGGKGNDWIAGEAGNDVLQGDEGHDHLLGGLGDDLYLYEQRGGHDVIEDSGGNDTLVLGVGITADRVRLFRRRDDLVVDLKGRDGSITVKNWFAGEADEIERIEFADGTVWGVDDIRNRAMRHRAGRGRVDDDDHGHRDLSDGDRVRKDRRGHEEEDDERSQRQPDRLADLLEAYLTQKPRYEFELLAEELTRVDGKVPALSAREIAHRWQAIARYASALSHEHDEDARGAALHRVHGYELSGGGAFGGGFGYAGSTGLVRGAANLRALQGLEEGFQRIRA